MASPPRYTLRAIIVVQAIAAVIMLFTRLWGWTAFLVRRMLQRYRLESQRVAFWLALQGAGVLSFLGLLPLRFALFPIAPP
ncbi:MAG: hypothetical protein WD278_10605 [Pirellulales bacterium]